MNDDELITTVREPFTAVHSTTPVEQIVSRSRAIRAGADADSPPWRACRWPPGPHWRSA